MSKQILRKLATTALATTALVSAVSFTAFASNPFAEKADSNKDGIIQLSEFTALGNQKFSEMDADANGLVTKEERKAYREHMREVRARKKFADADSNGDGVVSEAEFMTARAERKDRMEQRRDMNGAMNGAMNENGQFNSEDRRAGKKMHKKMPKKIRQHMSKWADIDTNGDGAVDLTEHQAATIARFERMDKNGDGVLGTDEQRPPRGMHD